MNIRKCVLVGFCGLLAIVAFSQVPVPDTNFPVRVTVRLAEEKGVFYGEEPLSATLFVSNATQQRLEALLVAAIAKDAGEAVTEVKIPVMLEGNAVAQERVSHRVDKPGFYRLSTRVELGGKSGRPTAFNLGYEPEKIAHASSAKADFKAFWEGNLAELAKVEPRYTMTLLTNLCTDVQEIYEVRMRSFGEVWVGGHYLVPKKPGKYPVVVRFLGYSSGPSLPARDGGPFIRYVASTRGQGVMKPQNVYGDWMAYRLDSRADYYYRGAFLDTVRAIDFVCSRPEVDQSRIAVEGGSQGGTLSYVCAALDKRVTFCMPTIPGFCDIPNFIALTQWPGCIYRNYLASNDKGVTKDALYDMLTYYDVKNFAPWITCPVFMGVGLQDNVCPPRTNFAPFNLLTSPKRYVIYPETSHGVRGADYHPKAYAWMMERFGMK